ncbi:MAG: hypothetical protein KAU38_13785, partial [Desulfobacterales bacterium]|nr:hypothetical protein [Desulfobacterales bacterium]
CWNDGHEVKRQRSYWNDVKNRNKNKTPFKPNIPVFQHSSIPWPRPGFHMAPVTILMSRQGGPIGAKPLSSDNAFGVSNPPKG